MFASAIIQTVAQMNVRVHELVVDLEYSGYEDVIAGMIAETYPAILVSFTSIGKKSPAHLASYKVHKKKKAAEITATLDILAKNAESALRATFSSNPKRVEPLVGPQALSLPPRIFDGGKFVKEGVWTLAKELRPGREIAVVYGEGERAQVAWEPILSIAIQRPEPVYDIEIEGTRNFIGNDIVAHNTAFVVNQGAPTDSLYINSSGNVGLGTTSPAQLLSVHGNQYTSGTAFFGSAITATSTFTSTAPRGA